ncbi:MAG: histidinol dehydrogenase, partial [Bacteroidetes bacterium]|nr:histidinol dehydrogenase [Bacteroidota bacterium]
MMKIINIQKKRFDTIRTAADNDRNVSIERTVAAILRKVEKEGDKAVRHYTAKFDGTRLRSLAVSQDEIASARKNADKKFVSIMRNSAENIRRFHTAQLRKPFSLSVDHRSYLRQIYNPIERAGVYVPGGKAAYPSTVLMNVIPAQVAGVKEIHLVSPPDAEGNVHKDVLLAASLLGIKNVYRIGGAQAVAA